VCAELLAENTNRAAALRTDCSRHCSFVDTPTSTELQLSSLLTTSARISVVTALRGSEDRTLRICRSTAEHALIVAVMCAAMETSASK